MTPISRVSPELETREFDIQVVFTDQNGNNIENVVPVWAESAGQAITMVRRSFEAQGIEPLVIDEEE